MSTEIQTFAPQTATGTLTVSVPFPYLAQSHVKLYINGVEDTAFQWISDGAIVPSLAVVAGDTVVVKRVTPRAALITELPTTGTLKGSDLNEQSLQAVYVATEAADGLREGLALDEATETYWEAAPQGVNRLMKNVLDPVNAQDAVTKGWYDAEVTTQTGAAATSAGTAATQAAAASSSASSAVASAASATASATTASAQASAAIASAASASTSETTASDALTWAENWAIRAEDSLIPVSMGSDGTEYSSYHYAQKASDSAAAAAVDEALAAAVSLAAARNRATQIIPYGETDCWAFNFKTCTFTCIDGSGTTGYSTGRGLPNQIDVHLKQWWDDNWGIGDANHDTFCREPGRDGMWAAPAAGIYGVAHVFDPETTYPIGMLSAGDDVNDVALETPSPARPGDTIYGWTRNSCTYTTSHGTQAPFVFANQNPVELTIASTTGGVHYIDSQWERAASGDVPAAKKTMKVCLKYSDDGTAQRYVKCSATNVDGTWWMVIDLLTMTVTADSGNWDSAATIWNLASFPGATMFIREFTTSTASATANNAFEIYFSEDSSGTTTYNGDGASKFYIGYAAIEQTTNYLPLTQGNVVSGSGNRGTIAEFNIVGGLDQNLPGFQAAYNHWNTQYTEAYHFNEWQGDVNGGGTKQMVHMLPYVGGQEVFRWWIDDTTKEIQCYYVGTTGGGSGDTYGTGITCQVAGRDNNGRGTRLQMATVQNGWGNMTVYVKINDGATQTATIDLSDSLATPATETTDFYTGIYLNSNDTTRSFAGINVMAMRFSRPFGADEVANLFVL